MYQIGKSHAGCIIKVVLASLLSPVSCASFPNVDDHSGCVLTLINLAAHHDKPGVWWEMAKSAEESARHQTAKVWALHVESAARAGADSPQRSQRKQWSHKSATVPNQAVIQRSSSPQMYWVWEEWCLPLEASVPWGPPITSVKSFCQASFTADLKTFLL